MSYCEHLYQTHSNGTNSVTVLLDGTEAISNSCHEHWGRHPTETPAYGSP